MSQTKYPLPDEIKFQCIGLVRGYERRVQQYHKKRNDILYDSRKLNIITYKEKNKDGEEEEYGELSRHGNRTTDGTFNKMLALDGLEKSYNVAAIKAVEQAKVCIGVDIPDDGERQKLMEAIWDSCILGRNFHFSHYGLPVGKDNFYERRRGFLWNIAKNMEFI